MKVLLIYPNFDPPVYYNKNDLRDSPGIPLGLFSIASQLKAEGHDVKFIDSRLAGKEVYKKVFNDSQDTDIVGISAMTAQVKEGLKISKIVKSCSSAKVVWGGIHATLFPEQTCKNEFIDFVVIGEGEETVSKLICELEKKKPDISKLKGIVYKNGGKIIKTDSQKPIVPDMLPKLDYGMIEVDRYITKSLPSTERKVRMLLVEVSRGCPHRCSFCIHVVGNDRRYRSKSVSRVIEDIKDIYNKYKVEMIAFASDNFFVNREFVKQLLSKLIEERINIKWSAECRADYFRAGHVDDELLELMQRTGCVELDIGAESGSQRVLDMLKKDVAVEEIKNSAKMCHKYKIKPSYSFITGIPGEQKTDAKRTIKLMIDIKKLCVESFAGIGIFRPYPGGELYNSAMKIGNIKEPDALTDWVKPGYSTLMTIKNNNIPWNKNKKFMLNLVHFGNLYFFTNKQLIKYIRRNLILGLGYSLFVILARARMRTGIFLLPIDKWAYKIALDLIGYNL